MYKHHEPVTRLCTSAGDDASPRGRNGCAERIPFALFAGAPTDRRRKALTVPARESGWDTAGAALRYQTP